MHNGDLRGHDFFAYTGEGDDRSNDDAPPVVDFRRRGTFDMPTALKPRDMSIDSQHAGPIAHDVPEGQETVVKKTVADPVSHIYSSGISPSNSLTATAHSPEETTRIGEGRDRGPLDDVELQDARHDKPDGTAVAPSRRASLLSALEIELYTVSYLIFFAVLGTLARLGLQALTAYPGAPVSFGVLWANVGGSLVMGFLAEDHLLFRPQWAPDAVFIDPSAAARAHLAAKKTIPLYIGLATGFCGSFTSFSSFVRDVFLALTNDLPGAVTAPRDGGYSFMAALAVVLTTVSLSLSALVVGGHLAAALEPDGSSAAYPPGRKILDRGAVLLGWGAWAGAVVLAVLPPRDAWRGQAVFSLAFAPVGCLARFYVSRWLNPRAPTFPLGTFAVNIAGVAVLGICWDLAHAGVGGVLGCQLLQGVEDGFCGCLTTVSTWVTELTALRRRHAYVYGVSSVMVGFAVLVVVMGSLRWSEGFGPLKCTH
ncbi:CrcB-like protein [Colletotrichum graminicola]|uniref:CrcB-like protein n=1 Tax=Colletotrichum graminicola (strain M1.001 / M2 / FGSC 10212) TaxID=645133 RepID=E3Q272_COLGM|nr:CrcB-like protein [Colletotrichum graminicola M1.001]EFQ25173.1 CrcB-like protein [Colletotrichum graminicola M1.001]WDK15205.1 CrcB-like protein [Colletotrichum graminicola]